MAMIDDEFEADDFERLEPPAPRYAERRWLARSAGPEPAARHE